MWNDVAGPPPHPTSPLTGGPPARAMIGYEGKPNCAAGQASGGGGQRLVVTGPALGRE